MGLVRGRRRPARRARAPGGRCGVATAAAGRQARVQDVRKVLTHPNPHGVSAQCRRSQRLLPVLATVSYTWRVEEMQDTASLLRELRRAQGRSLRSAANDLGLAPSYLSRLERGQRRPTPEVAERLANYYDVSSERIALAEGRVPDDVLTILQQHPQELDRLRRLYRQSRGEDSSR